MIEKQSDSTCPYCQHDGLDVEIEYSNRTQHSHRQIKKTTHRCPDCGYKQIQKRETVARSNNLNGSTFLGQREVSPEDGFLVVDATDGEVICSTTVEGREEVVEEIERAEEYKKDGQTLLIFIGRTDFEEKDNKMVNVDDRDPEVTITEEIEVADRLK
jgi:uncharacterized Zn finger protein (UPF0148 family)